MLMLIKVPCPCGQQIQVTPTHAGKDLKCPVCGRLVGVPAMGILDPPSAPPLFSVQLEPVAPPPSIPSPRSGGPLRRPWLAGAIAGLILLGITTASVQFFRSQGEPIEVPSGGVVHHQGPEGQLPPPGSPPRSGIEPRTGPLELHVMELQSAIDQGRRALQFDDLDEAARHLQSAAQIAPTDPQVVRALKELETARADSKGREALEKLRTERVQSQAKAQDIARQLERLRADKAQRDREAEAVTKRLNQLRKELPADAIKTAKEKASRAETESSFQQLLINGWANLRAKKYDAAVADLTLAVTLDQTSIEANNALKEARAGQARVRAEVRKSLSHAKEALTVGNLAEASQAMQTAILLAPEDPEVLRTQYQVKAREEMQPQVTALLKSGLNLVEDGQFDLAAGAFAKAVRLVPEVPAYRNLLQMAKQASQKQHERQRQLDQAREVARVQAIKFDTMQTLREQTDRMVAELKVQIRSIQVQSERMAAASRVQVAGIMEQSERMAFASGLQIAGIREQTGRMTTASQVQLTGIREQSDRMASAARLQTVGLLEQTERMTGAAGAQVHGILTQTDRMTAASGTQQTGMREQTDRMTAASGASFRVLREQGERMTGAARVQMVGLMAQTDRMTGAANAQVAGMMEQTDRMARASGVQMGGIREQTDRATAAASAQMTGLQEQGDRMAGAARQQLTGLVEQTDRMSGAAQAQLGGLRQQSERMAAANQTQMAGLLEQTDRMTGAANAQVNLLQAQTQRMAEAAGSPIVPFRVPVDLASLLKPSEDPGPKPTDPAALARYEERQRRLREEAELKRLRAEKEKQERDESELQRLLTEKDQRNKDALELRQLLEAKERVDSLKQFLTPK